MKKGLHLPVCPYCGCRTNYLQAWVLRRKGEYFCPKCGGLVNVVLNGLLSYLAFLTVLIGATFFCLGMAFGEKTGIVSLYGIFGTAVIFLIASPFFVRLRKPQTAPRPEMQKHNPAAQTASFPEVQNRRAAPQPDRKDAAPDGTVRRPSPGEKHA